jgi:hypothetical protein
MNIKQILLDRQKYIIDEKITLDRYDQKLLVERKSKIKYFTDLLENGSINVHQREIDVYTKMVNENNSKKERVLQGLEELKQSNTDNHKTLENFMLDTQINIDDLDKITSAYERKIAIASSALRQNHEQVDAAQLYDVGYINTQIASMVENSLIMQDMHKIQIKKESTRAYIEGDFAFINYLSRLEESSWHEALTVSKEAEEGIIDDRGARDLIAFLRDKYLIDMEFSIAFILRLRLVEYYRVVFLSKKNKKLDYKNNYLNQYKSLADKAAYMGITLGSPLRNPQEIKDLIVLTIQVYKDHINNECNEYNMDNEYTAKDVIEDLLQEEQSRLKKRSVSPTKA